MAQKCKTFTTTASNLTGLKTLDGEVQKFLDLGHKIVTISTLYVPVSAERSSFQAMLIYEDTTL
jgi:hypothetical protein